MTVAYTLAIYLIKHHQMAYRLANWKSAVIPQSTPYLTGCNAPGTNHLKFQVRQFLEYDVIHFATQNWGCNTLSKPISFIYFL